MLNRIRIEIRQLEVLTVLILVASVLVIYWQVQDFWFINYDDVSYVTENYHVKGGLTAKGVLWAFTDIHTGYWHPLTWLSHMLDWQLFQGNAGGHHWTSVLIHIANTLLLWIVFRRMTGDIWKSVFVAALFAVHPLNVESVAWIAERKNVLSTFSWFSALWCYVFYAECPGLKRYLPVILVFILGLMTKPMLVTLPFVMLLLDYWPLRRFQTFADQNYGDFDKLKKFSFGRNRLLFQLILEKVPFLIISLAVSIFTFLAARHQGAVPDSSLLPWNIRVIHATVSYVRYIGKAIWPEGLAVFYPYPDVMLISNIIAAAIILLSITLVAIVTLRRHPYLAVGWFWFLGTLIPVIGLVQAGEQAMADRYAYVPLVGIFMMISWGIPAMLKKRRTREAWLPVACCVLVFPLGVTAFHQTRFWKDSVTLFGHAIDVTKGNYVAHNNLGITLAEQGKFEEAMIQYHIVSAMKPKNALVYSNIGNILAKQGKYDEAINSFRKALQLCPNNYKTYNNMGIALAGQGNTHVARACFQKALQLEPDDLNSVNNLGMLLLREQKLEASKACFAKVIKSAPDHADAHNNMGLVLAREGKKEEALTYFLKAVHINPEFSQAKHNLMLTFRSIKNH